MKKIFSVLVLGLLFSGCGDQAQSSQPTTAENPPTPQKPLRLLFVGDTEFGEVYERWIIESEGENILGTKGYDYTLEKVAPLTKRADLVFANLETPVTKQRKSPYEGKKQYIHWADIHKTPPTLKSHNIGVVSLGNNHAMDFALEGLRQTVKALEKNGVFWIGAGMNEEEASKPFQRDFKLNDKNFRLIVAAGYKYVRSYDEILSFYAHGTQGGVNAWTLENAARQIHETRQTNPDAFIVAFPHGGNNYSWKNPEQTLLAHTLVDAGADLVLGHGAHKMQEIERYRGKWILYDLGNFVFNSPGRYQFVDAEPYSLAAQLEATEKNGEIHLALRLYPILSDNLVTHFQPHIVTKLQLLEVLKLLLLHSPDRATLKKNLTVAQDEIGGCLLLDLSP